MKVCSFLHGLTFQQGWGLQYTCLSYSTLLLRSNEVDMLSWPERASMDPARLVV
jgi:hypothetical protein